jgi:hypothetical protein
MIPRSLEAPDAFIQMASTPSLISPNRMKPSVPPSALAHQPLWCEIKHLRFPIGDFGLPTPEQMRPS